MWIKLKRVFKTAGSTVSKGVKNRNVNNENEM
jgi:hypothetical protein